MTDKSAYGVVTSIVPKGVGMAMQAMGSDIAHAVRADAAHASDLSAGKFGPAMTTWLRTMATEYVLKGDCAVPRTVVDDWHRLTTLCVFRYIDRMNDLCEQDTAETILREFVADVMPTLEGGLKAAQP